MKLVSSSPTPRHHHRNNPRHGSFRRRLLSRVFSVRTAWWLLVVIVGVFAITVVKMFRHAIELAPQ